MKFIPKSTSSELWFVSITSISFLALCLIAFRGTWFESLAPLSFLYPAIAILWAKKIPIEHYGLKKFLPSIDHWKIFGLTTFITLVPYFLVLYFFQSGEFNLNNVPNWRDLFSQTVFQVLIVALPEEFFFRGYLQTRIAELPQYSRKNFRFLKTNFVGGLFPVLLSNSLFACIHLFGNLNPLRLLTFFPGLIFAFLWARTGNLTVVILYHALCNLVLFIFTAVF